jgi:hypothetical protein
VIETNAWWAVRMQPCRGSFHGQALDGAVCVGRATPGLRRFHWANPHSVRGTGQICGVPHEKTQDHECCRASRASARGATRVPWRGLPIGWLARFVPTHEGPGCQPSSSSGSSLRAWRSAHLLTSGVGDELGRPRGEVPACGRSFSVWVRKLRLADRLPSRFAEALDAVEAFAAPSLAAWTSGLVWQPGRRSWDKYETLRAGAVLFVEHSRQAGRSESPMRTWTRYGPTQDGAGRPSCCTSVLHIAVVGCPTWKA